MLRRRNCSSFDTGVLYEEMLDIASGGATQLVRLEQSFQTKAGVDNALIKKKGLGDVLDIHRPGLKD